MALATPGEGIGRQASVTDGLRAHVAPAVGVVGEPTEGGVDVVEHSGGVGDERVVVGVGHNRGDDVFHGDDATSANVGPCPAAPK
jgi:hypothetical protein